LRFAKTERAESVDGGKCAYDKHGKTSARRYPEIGALDPAADRRTRMAVEPRLKVSVDQERCQGHARCAALAPELFTLDELGNAREVGDGIVPPRLEDKAWLAKANCPELAVEIVEE
jgi:ferredoxin